jgi:hypothetical protein
VITFMSVLELSRLGFTSVYQNEDVGPIHIHTKHVIGQDVVSQVQELQTEPVASEAAYTTKVANVFDEEPEVAATDADIEEREKQLELEAPPAVTALEDQMLADLGGRIETIPELNQPEEMATLPLTDADLAAVRELSDMEMQSMPEDGEPAPEPAPESARESEGEASV